MKKVKVLSPAEAAMLIKDGDTVATGGFVGSGAPETLASAVEKRFLETGEPKNIINNICQQRIHRHRMEKPMRYLIC